MRRFSLVLAGFVALAVLVSGCGWRNAPPVATFTRTPSVGSAPLSVFFDAERSVDPDGTVALYTWDFGDGSSGDGQVVTHTYGTPGLYEATLTLVDDQGGEANAVRMIDVRPTDAEREVGLESGDLAPDFTLLDLYTGEARSLSDFRGYVILLDFWASSCPPCRLSMPHLDALRERYAPDGLVVIGVNEDVSSSVAREFIDAEGYQAFTLLKDTPDEATRTLYEVEGIPHTFIIDRQGIVRYDEHPIRIRDRDIEPWL